MMRHCIQGVSSVLSRAAGLFAMCSAMVLFTAGCSDDLATTPTQTDPHHIYFSMQANHGAITLASVAPYNTLQLAAIPYAADGTVLSTTAKVLYSMSDSSGIRVSEDGLLQADAESGSAQVYISLTVDGVTYADTVDVTIYPSTSLPKIASAMIVRPADSTKRSYFGTYPLHTEVRDSNDVTVNGIPVRIFVKDSAHFTYSRENGRLEYNRLRFNAGSAMVYARATIFGKEYLDSMEWTLGYPTSGSYSIYARTLPGQQTPVYTFSTVPEAPIYIGVGGIVRWYSGITDSTFDVVFDDPSLAKATTDSPDNADGNIAPFLGGIVGWGYKWQSRKFTRPGTIRFKSTKFPIAAGTIIVVDERKCLPDCPPIP